MAASLPLHVRDHALFQRALSGHTHFGRKGRSGAPLATRPRGRLLEHFINLFERKTFSFRHDKVGVNTGASAEAAPNKEYFGAEVAVLLADEVGAYHCENL